jgi:hypothetical protein
MNSVKNISTFVLLQNVYPLFFTIFLVKVTTYLRTSPSFLYLRDVCISSILPVLPHKIFSSSSSPNAKSLSMLFGKLRKNTTLCFHFVEGFVPLQQFTVLMPTFEIMPPPPPPDKGKVENLCLVITCGAGWGGGG